MGTGVVEPPVMMLPSERNERWVRRILFAALILIALYLVLWLIRFVTPIWGRVLQQRQPPPEAIVRTTRVG